MKQITGGVCAPKGFKANGIHCGIRKNKTKKDLALIVSEKRACCAGVYTKNLVHGAPINVTRENIKDGYAQAIICNSGNANTCNANGMEIAYDTCALVEKYTGIAKNDVVVASTGVIGQQMTIEPFANGMEELVAGLGDKSTDAANAIMTTDTRVKEISFEFELGGKTCRIGGIAKGSGMIHPNMATMLVFVTTDVSISPAMLQKALSNDILDTFNMVSVDGDTSTNDMVMVLANSMAENTLIENENEDYEKFCQALYAVNSYLCRMIAQDGEGATKLITCNVVCADTKQCAKIVAKSIICSSLLKAAMFGADANWGRVLCAIGYSGASVDVNKIDVEFASKAGTVEVCKNGAGIDFSEEKAKEVLSEAEIEINVSLNMGNEKSTAWGCDLTYDYVKINGDYRT